MRRCSACKPSSSPPGTPPAADGEVVLLSDPQQWTRRPGEGRYARPERERRFLARALPEVSGSTRLIEDRYLVGTTLRLRHVRVGVESVYKLTQKVRGQGPAEVSLTNIYLTPEEHGRLSALPAAVLTKTRSVCASGSRTFVVDEFSGHLHGLRLAELEVQDLDEQVLLPDWLGIEVTDDDRFSGGALAVADDAQVQQLLGMSP